MNDGWIERLKKQMNGKSVVLPKVSLDDLAYTVYSSGTTGKPKGNTTA